VGQGGFAIRPETFERSARGALSRYMRATSNRRRLADEEVFGFAHPVERELARVLDDHGVAWQYEPHTFILERDPDGTVREAFTPDFYLPDLGVYIECTVMRSGLMSRKRRKVRKMQRRGVSVEILGRTDIERLARRWELLSLARAANGSVHQSRRRTGDPLHA
jgi:hypothetical protein